MKDNRKSHASTLAYGKYTMKEWLALGPYEQAVVVSNYRTRQVVLACAEEVIMGLEARECTFM